VQSVPCLAFPEDGRPGRSPCLACTPIVRRGSTANDELAIYRRPPGPARAVRASRRERQVNDEGAVMPQQSSYNKKNKKRRARKMVMWRERQLKKAAEQAPKA
jgi:hypothetical protein